MDLTIYRSEQLPDNKVYWHFASLPLIVFKREDGWTTRGMTYDESIELAKDFRSYLKSQENVIVPWEGKLRSDYCGSYLQSASGEPPVILSRNFKKDRTPRGVGNFSKAVRDGKIVVNDYDSDLTVTIKAQGKNEILTRSPYSNVYSWPAVMLHTQPDPRGTGKDVYVWRGMFLTDFRFRSGYNKHTERTTSNFGNYDIDKHISACVKQISELKVDEANVVSALAKANQGQFDVLSNLAELPETVMGILSGIREIFRMYKEARKGDFRLQNKISRLRRIANPTLNQRKQLADALEASASVWLTYRLSISPTVGVVEDLIDLYFKGLVDFERYRETKRDNVVDLSYNTDGSTTIPVVERAFIKRKYDLTISKFGFPPLGAAWELVPLSFVLDRYVNIGELLSAFSPDLSVEQGATYSWKVTGSASGNYNDLVDYQVTVSHYKRRVINPYHYCGLNFPPSRTFKQDLDHLSLFWSIVMDDYVRPSKSRKY